MQSRFEENARRAAVEAVERRWERKNAEARRTARRESARSFFACLVLLGALAAGGLFAARHFGVEMPGGDALADFGRLIRRLGGLTDSDRSRMESFAEAIAAFDVAEIRPWKSAPPEMRPKRAPAGFAYRMLVEKAGGVCGIYEMVADGKGGVSVRELSPVGKETKASLAAFNKAKVGGVYLVACAGGVYVCGSDDAEAGRTFLRRWTAAK